MPKRMYDSDTILNDPAFVAMERGFRKQAVAVERAFGGILADEFGELARSLFHERVLRDPPSAARCKD